MRHNTRELVYLTESLSCLVKGPPQQTAQLMRGRWKSLGRKEAERMRGQLANDLNIDGAPVDK